jgi:cysteine-rich repeat protein
MNRPRQAARLVRRVLSGARTGILLLGVLSLVFACTTATNAKDDKECSPGNRVYCRCRDRQEGSRVCNDDGLGFGPCEPCESADNPVEELEPGDPFLDDDAGAEDDSGGLPTGSCGNGVVENDEDCDDKNTIETDGCNSKCRLAGATAQKTNACPGLDVHVWGGAHAPTLAGTTVGSGNRSTKTGCNTNGNVDTRGGPAPDRVFKVVAHKTGSMNVTVTETSYNAFLYVSEACPAGNVEWLACANKVDGAGGETLSFPVASGKAYYVFVDGALPSSGDQRLIEGSYRVTFSIL